MEENVNAITSTPGYNTSVLGNEVIPLGFDASALGHTTAA